ncbi:hypothetical protein V1512DRAFT_200453 [Lipomyces arxii]|uniref:uncharacterized protein n=1 Tax=Lipomyces arxii TaxID=56418 RepID=UPI0034CFBDD5
MLEKIGFELDDIPQLNGKVAIVTGGNSGIGEVISRELARRGCKVYIAGRSQSRIEAAIARIKAAIGMDENLFALDLDLETMKGAVASAKHFMKLENRLDILMANAGLVALESELTPEGYEKTFCHLGHFAFVTTLLPLIEQTADDYPESDVRIVVTSSRSYASAKKIDYDDVKKAFNGSGHLSMLFNMLGRYARSKLCNIYFAKELAEILASRKNVYVNAMHPGVIPTNIFNLTNSPLPRYLQAIGTWQAKVIGLNVDDGSKTGLFLATSPLVISKDFRGEMIYPGPWGLVYYRYVYKHNLNDLALNVDEQKHLWSFSENALEEALS